MIDWSQIVTAEALAAQALADARQRAMAELIAWSEATARGITGDVPLVERLSWGTKDLAARAYLAGIADDAARTLIETEAAVSGQTPEHLAGRIVANANQYRQAIAALTGIRIAAVRSIQEAATVAEVEAAVATARATWEAMP